MSVAKLAFIWPIFDDYFLNKCFGEVHCCLETGKTLETTLAIEWHNICQERIFGDSYINDVEEFSGFQISRKKDAIYELNKLFYCVKIFIE